MFEFARLRERDPKSFPLTIGKNYIIQTSLVFSILPDYNHPEVDRIWYGFNPATEKKDLDIYELILGACKTNLL